MNNIPRISTKIEGFRNPCRAVAAWLKGAGLPYDAESFDRVAEIVGDVDSSKLDGLIVSNLDHVQYLCRIGGFVIATPPDMPDGSPVRAYTVGEWASMIGELQ